MDKDMHDKIMKGTTTIGVVCSDGIVLGADSRATMGTFISSGEVPKIFKIDNNVGITVAGGVGDAQALIRIMRAQNEIYKMSEGRPLSPKAATSLLSIILQDNKMFPYYVQLIVGGVDGDKTGLYSLDAFGGHVEETTISATGSGTEPAIGYLESVYRKGMTTKDAVKEVTKALAIAMKRNAATGNNMSIAVITKDGYKETFVREQDKTFGSSK
jgi:proteasome beta subunit